MVPSRNMRQDADCNYIFTRIAMQAGNVKFNDIKGLKIDTAGQDSLKGTTHPVMNLPASEQRKATVSAIS